MKRWFRLWCQGDLALLLAVDPAAPLKLRNKLEDLHGEPLLATDETGLQLSTHDPTRAVTRRHPDRY
jgi:hypothetical protein